MHLKCHLIICPLQVYMKCFFLEFGQLNKWTKTTKKIESQHIMTDNDILAAIVFTVIFLTLKSIHDAVAFYARFWKFYCHRKVFWGLFGRKDDVFLGKCLSMLTCSRTQTANIKYSQKERLTSCTLLFSGLPETLTVSMGVSRWNQKSRSSLRVWVRSVSFLIEQIL